ncbi:hypothetical protein FSHL1_002587 [Fusarium sambucinum]
MAVIIFWCFAYSRQASWGYNHLIVDTDPWRNKTRRKSETQTFMSATLIVVDDLRNDNATESYDESHYLTDVTMGGKLYQ